MGVNMGILPTKGLTLPLISSGGSSVLMTCAAVGLLLRVSRELDRAERRHAARLRGDTPAGRVEPEIDAEAVASGPRPMPITATMSTGRGGRARIEPRLDPRFGANR
jgi:cell division protein FtsW